MPERSLTSARHPHAGVLFFALVLFSGPLDPMLAAIGLTPLMAAVLVGAAQNVFSKSAKYSLFDPCKEMAYIPLDKETQVCRKCCTLQLVFVSDAFMISVFMLLRWR